MQKSIRILTLYRFMFALNLFLHIYRIELARSPTNGNNSSKYCYICTCTVLRQYCITRKWFPLQGELAP